MKKITLLITLISLLFYGKNLNAQVIDVDWQAGTPTGWPAPANNITVPSPWTITGEAGVDFLSFGGSNGLKLRTLNTSDDLWLGYHATGLTMGTNYKIEATLRTQNNKVDMTLYAWPESQGNSPTGVTVLGSPLAGFVDNADTAYSVTFEATSTSMVFGVGVNRNSGSPTAMVRSFKVTEVTGGSSTETDITGFTLAEQTGSATIDSDAHTVAIEVAYGTSLASLSPTITLSSGATVNPNTGVATDFSGGAVTYTVTAEDATTTQDWSVTVAEAAASTATDITGFTLSEQASAATIDSGAHTVAIEVVNGTSLTSLTPTITLSSGATVNPASGVAQDFSSSVNYTVTAQDGTTNQIWSVTVTEAAATADVFSFNLANQTESDAFVASLPSGFASTGTISSNQWGGTYGVRINGNSTLTYSATGLAAGDYRIEGVIMVQNLDHTWIQDVWETGGSEATPVVQTGTAGSFVTYTKTVTVPSSGNYTFGIVRGNHGSQLYVQSWKATKFTTHTSAGDGDWDTDSTWDSGEVPSEADNVIIDHVVTKTSGSATVNDLTVNATKSLTLSAGVSLIVNGTSTGDVTYNRTLTEVSGDANGWHLVASPVAGETYNNAYATANSLATSTTNTSLRGLATYDDSAGAGSKWSYLSTTDSNAGTFTSGIGYSMKRSATGTVAFTGTINTDDVDGVTVSTDSDGFNLLGNPYTSYMSSQTFLTANSNLESTIWTWSHGSGYTARTSGENFILAPGQGFFVDATSGTTVNFAESNQSSGTDNFQKSSKTQINLTITDGDKNRGAKVYYLSNATNGLDNGYEGKLFGGVSHDLAIYTHLLSDSVGDDYQVQSVPNTGLEDMIIPVGIIASTGKEITISAEAFNLPQGLKVFLEDRSNGSFTELTATSNFKETLKTNLNGIGRFYLHTKSSALSTETAELEGVSIYTLDRSTLRLAGLSQGTAKVKLYNILGKQMLNTSFETTGVSDVRLPSLSAGIYIVQLETENGKLNKKIALE